MRKSPMFCSSNRRSSIFCFFFVTFPIWFVHVFSANTLWHFSKSNRLETWHALRTQPTNGPRKTSSQLRHSRSRDFALKVQFFRHRVCTSFLFRLLTSDFAHTKDRNTHIESNLDTRNSSVFVHKHMSSFFSFFFPLSVFLSIGLTHVCSANTLWHFGKSDRLETWHTLRTPPTDGPRRNSARLRHSRSSYFTLKVTFFP